MSSSQHLSAGCRLRFRPRGPGVILLQIEAAQLARQVVASERLDILADDGRPLAAERWTAADGNRRLRLVLPAQGFPAEVTVAYSVQAALDVLSCNPAAVNETPLSDIPQAVLPYLLASRYCQSDRLQRFALREFGDLAPGHGRVTAICNWIYDHLEYVKGSSDAHTTAHDTLVSRSGVCRDFAHLGIALSRALGIPARFVSAYAAGLQPPDFHAVFEAYVGGRWYLFDPTRQAAVDRLALIGVGRDATDVSFATIYGDILPSKPEVTACCAAPPLTDATLRAISLSDDQPA